MEKVLKFTLLFSMKCAELSLIASQSHPHALCGRPQNISTRLHHLSRPGRGRAVHGSLFEQSPHSRLLVTV